MNIRNLSAIYIIKNNQVLLLYKAKSRVFNNPMWLTIGGHFEDVDNGNPLNCAKRELMEEIGLTFDDFQKAQLKYITIRKTKDELRQQYIYIVYLKDGVNVPEKCDEGLLEWTDIDSLSSKNMSITNTAVLNHYFKSSDIQNDNMIYTGIAIVNDEVPSVQIAALGEYDTTH